MSQIDQNLIAELAQIRERFPMMNIQFSFEQLIAKYLRIYHRSCCKNELGKRDAFCVMNLCVAYKFLLHRKLVNLCFQGESSSSYLQRSHDLCASSILHQDSKQEDVSMGPIEHKGPGLFCVS